MSRRGNRAAPLVLHVIPTPLGRGAQRAARSLVDRLDGTSGTRHQLLSLYEGPDDVAVDLNLHLDGHGRPPTGFHPDAAWRLRRTIRGLDPAVAVAHGGDSLKYLVPAVVGTGCALVYCDIGTFAGPGGPARQWPWGWLTRRPDRVVAVGDEVLDECTGRFGVDPGRVVMIPNGRDPAEFRPDAARSASGHETTLIFVGALVDQKQPGRFVDIVGRLRQDGRTFRAQVVGSGPLADSLADRAAIHGVELLGFRSDVPQLLRGADILVFPSRPAGEGMPGVLIEAGLSGLAVVSTPVPGASSVIAQDHTGLIVDGSVDAMTEAVRQLLDDPDRRVAMGAAGRARCVSLYSLDVMADQWGAVLQPLVEGQRGTGRRPDPAARRSEMARARLRRSLRGSSHS